MAVRPACGVMSSSPTALWPRPLNAQLPVRRWRVQGGGHNVPECSKIICGLTPEATLRLP
jgi:hypothetical protein